METFKIEIQEFLSKIIEVDAADKEEAILKVKEMYQKEEIILDSEDYVLTEIEEYQEQPFYLLHGDTMDLLPQFDHKFDMIFADPPYFLSNNGLSIQSGKIVSVNKGKWDKS